MSMSYSIHKMAFHIEPDYILKNPGKLEDLGSFIFNF